MRGTSEEHQRGPLLPLGSPSSRCRVLPSQRADHLSPAGSFPNICVVAGSLPVHMISAGGQRTKVSRGHGGDFGSGSCDQLRAGDGARRLRGEPLRTGTGGRDDHCPSHPPGAGCPAQGVAQPANGGAGRPAQRRASPLCRYVDTVGVSDTVGQTSCHRDCPEETPSLMNE